MVGAIQCRTLQGEELKTMVCVVVSFGDVWLSLLVWPETSIAFGYHARMKACLVRRVERNSRMNQSHPRKILTKSSQTSPPAIRHHLTRYILVVSTIDKSRMLPLQSKQNLPIANKDDGTTSHHQPSRSTIFVLRSGSSWYGRQLPDDLPTDILWRECRSELWSISIGSSSKEAISK